MLILDMKKTRDYDKLLSEYYELKYLPDDFIFNREILEGIRVIAYKSSNAIEQYRCIFEVSKTDTIKISNINDIIFNLLYLKVEEIFTPLSLYTLVSSRKSDVTDMRCIISYILYDRYNFSLKDIASLLVFYDSNIRYYLEMYNSNYTHDKKFRTMADKVLKALYLKQ
jgi:hypothetical protein